MLRSETALAFHSFQISRVLRSKAFLVLISALLCSPVWAADPSPDATAKFLAGLPVRDTPLESYVNVPGWTSHANELDRAWKQLDQRQLSKISAWAPQALGTAY